MATRHIFNTDIISGNVLWIDSIQSTGSVIVANCNLNVKENLTVFKNTQLSGTVHVDQDAVLKSNLYLEDDLNVGENTQLSGTIHVDQDAVFRSGLFVEGNAQINGNLYVSGDRVIMETSTVRVEDKNIELAVLDSATDATADQGGITLKGTTDKTILWSNATDSWDLSENVGVADGKYIFTDKVRARNSAGLSLVDDVGNGIFIKDGGNVGIGSSSPTHKLHINAKSNNSSAALFIDAKTRADTIDLVKIDGGVASNNSNVFTIKSDGKAGIGTASPGSTLEVAGTIMISCPNNISENNRGLWFGKNGVVQGYIGGGNFAVNNINDDDFGISAAEDGDLVFGTTASLGGNGHERMRITSLGNVGIGTTGPGERLDVNGRIRIENSTAPTTTSNRLYAVGGNLFWDGENVLHARDTIGEMEDTSIGTKSNGQVLIWNATSSKWVNNALTGGNGIDVTNAAGGITISHTDTSSATSSNNSGRTYIQDIGLDTYGHVTSLATRTHSNAAITLAAGSGMSGGGSFDLDQSSAETITISHTDTSSATSSNNSGRTYIQDIGLDTYGHVTSLSTATETVVDTNTWRAISSTPTNGAATTSISSDWAFDNVKTAVPANAVFTDTVPTFSYNSTTKTLTITT